MKTRNRKLLEALKRLAANMRVGAPRVFKRVINFFEKNPVVTRVVAFLGVVGTIMGIVTTIIGWLPQKCEINNTLNVGVANFSRGAGVSQADARDFSELFYNQYVAHLEALDAELGNPGIDTCGPDLIKPIPGKTPEERAEAAARRAEELSLDFLIYGVIERRSETFLELTPEFFVESVNIEDTIGGSFAFGAPIIFSNNRADQNLANEELKRRTNALLLATRGLALYSNADYEGAIEFFERANEPALWPSSRNREVLYILLGNADMRAGRYEAADAAYSAALALEPEYSRSYVGKGNLAYLQALESDQCNAFAPDLSRLQEAQSLYDQALQARVQPPTADIHVKVAFGTAQIHLVYWFVGKESTELAEATRLFESVIAAYGNGDQPRLREMASESHNLLGLAAGENLDNAASIERYEAGLELTQDPARRAWAGAQLSRLYQESDVDKAERHALNAIDEYQRARIRTTQPEQAAFYWRQIARLYEQLGHREDAIAAMRDAVLQLPEDHKCASLYQEYLNTLQSGE